MATEIRAALEEECIQLTRWLAIKAWREFDKTLWPGGVTWPQFLYLRALHEGKADTPSQIARLFAVDTGAITRLTDRLERGGFLQRRARAGDRRVVSLELTKAGRAVVQRLLPVARKRAHQLCRNLSERDLKSLATLMRKALKRG